MTNAPLWALSMDIGQEYAGVAGGMMNTGFGIAGIISPIIFGALVQATGNWTLPFVVSSALLLIGAGVTYFIRPTGVLRRAEYQEQLKRPSVQPTG
jgi:MFS family permease